MKKLLLSLLFLIPILTAVAQERKTFRLQPEMPQRTEGFVLPDSLAHLSPWRPQYTVPNPFKPRPAVSMTSLVVVPQHNRPKHVNLLKNNTLRIRVRFNISNGQHWNHSPFPDAFLDARTISVPLPR